MNATFQALFNLPSLEAKLQPSSEVKSHLFHALTRLYALIYPNGHNHQLAVNPSVIRRICGRNNLEWSSGKQQDAFEFVEDLINRLPELRPFFEFTINSTYDTTLRLSIRCAASLAHPITLASLFPFDSAFTELSDVLLTQLPRFTPSGSKSQNMISFPRRLQREWLPVPVMYELKAVMSHYGDSAHFGHYKAFIHRNSEWLECDDEKPVLSVSFDRVVHSHHVYGLFYHRIDKKASVPVESLDCQSIHERYTNLLVDSGFDAGSVEELDHLDINETLHRVDLPL